MTRWQALRVALGIGLGLVTSELVFRGVLGGPVHLPIYAEGGGAGVTLAPGVEVVARLPLSGPYTVRVVRGFRAPVPAKADWLVVGDSAAFGLGVEGEQTVAAQLTERGLSAANAGIPGFSVPDALAHARSLASDQGVLVVVNPADDALPVEATVSTRFEVAGRWLVTRGTSTWVKGLLSSPLSRSVVLSEAAGFGGLIRHGRGDPRPGWVSAEDGGFALMRAVGKQVRRYAAERLPPVRVVWLPFDAVVAPGRPDPSPYARMATGWDDSQARAGLVEGLGPVPLLVPDLGPDAFLPGDHHLSPEGHAALADALVAWLR